jgi:hypothetical protein
MRLCLTRCRYPYCGIVDVIPWPTVSLSVHVLSGAPGLTALLPSTTLEEAPSDYPDATESPAALAGAPPKRTRVPLKPCPRRPLPLLHACPHSFLAAGQRNAPRPVWMGSAAPTTKLVSPELLES